MYAVTGLHGHSLVKHTHTLSSGGQLIDNNAFPNPNHHSLMRNPTLNLILTKT